MAAVTTGTAPAGELRVDLDALDKLSPKLHQACEALGRCIDRFEVEPIPPNGAPPAVQAMVTQTLSALFKQCVEIFRGSEEKIGKLCDDVDQARADYARMDEQNAQDVAAPVNDETEKPATSPEKSAPAAEPKNTEPKNTQPENTEPVAPETVEPATPLTDPVTQASAQAASDRFDIVDASREDIDDFRISPLAQDQANVDAEGPDDLIDFDAERDELVSRGDSIKAQLSDETRAAQTYTNTSLNDVIKQADTYHSDVEAFKRKHDGYFEIAQSDIRIANRTDGNTSRYDDD
ncbi:MAG: hypothetical protein RI885_1998 [Actinomycetota bacterium]|jgi:hypothetical protein